MSKYKAIDPKTVTALLASAGDSLLEEDGSLSFGGSFTMPSDQLLWFDMNRISKNGQGTVVLKNDKEEWSVPVSGVSAEELEEKFKIIIGVYPCKGYNQLLTNYGTCLIRGQRDIFTWDEGTYQVFTWRKAADKILVDVDLSVSFTFERYLKIFKAINDPLKTACDYLMYFRIRSTFEARPVRGGDGADHYIYVPIAMAMIEDHEESWLILQAILDDQKFNNLPLAIQFFKDNLSQVSTAQRDKFRMDLLKAAVNATNIEEANRAFLQCVPKKSFWQNHKSSIIFGVLFGLGVAAFLASPPGWVVAGFIGATGVLAAVAIAGIALAGFVAGALVGGGVFAGVKKVFNGIRSWFASRPATAPNSQPEEKQEQSVLPCSLTASIPVVSSSESVKSDRRPVTKYNSISLEDEVVSKEDEGIPIEALGPSYYCAARVFQTTDELASEKLAPTVP